MDRYMIFDVERFIRDSRSRWGKEKLERTRERENLLGLKALSQDTPVQTSNISNTTANVAIKLSEVQNEIDRLDHYDKSLRRALSELTDKEYDAIEAFFFKRSHIYANVNEFCAKYDCEPMTAYRTRRRALDKIRLEIMP